MTLDIFIVVFVWVGNFKSPPLPISVPKRKQFPAYSIAFKIIDRVNVSFGRFSIFVHIRKIFIVLRREINLVEDRVPFQAIRVGNLWVAKSFALYQFI